MSRERSVALRLALPKGRMEAGITRLFEEAGVHVQSGARCYRPAVGLENAEAKLLKPQNIVEMLQTGSRDVGFAGADWVAELGAEIVEVLDTELDPVRVVLAAPPALLDASGALPARSLVIASEYERLTRSWIAGAGREDRFLRSYGATEVLPPEDADCIVDNTATGATLRENGLEIIADVMRSTTRLYAHPVVLDDPGRRGRIEDFVMLLRSVLDARARVILEVNVSADRLEEVIAVLPAMREPTVASLHGQCGYAVKSAVPRALLPRLIPAIRAAGGADIVVMKPSQIVA